jgi:CBS domain-containing protein
VRAKGWELCVVVNEGNIVLGRLVRAALEGDADATVEAVMEPGPVTYRPHVVAEDAARTLAERHVQSVLVTTGDGELIGVFRAEDAISSVRTSGNEPK